MIAVGGSKARLVCDECEADIEQETGRGTSPGAARDALWFFAKRAGWRAFKRGGAWRHACPRCVADFARRPTDRTLL